MTVSLLRAPHDIRRDRKRSAKYVQTHELLEGFVNRVREERIHQDLVEALERALAEGV